MVDIVKTAFNVALDCPYRLVGRFGRSIYHIDNISDGVFLCSVRSESVTVRIKPRFTYRLYDNPDTFLNNPIQDRRYSKRSFLAVAFGYVYPFGRFRLVTADIFPYQLDQFLFWHLKIFVHSILVNSGSFTALVRLDIMNSCDDSNIADYRL